MIYVPHLVSPVSSHQRVLQCPDPSASRLEEWTRSTENTPESAPTTFQLGPHLSPQSRSLNRGTPPGLFVSWASQPQMPGSLGAWTNSVLKQHHTHSAWASVVLHRSVPASPPGALKTPGARATREPENRCPTGERGGMGQTFRHINIKSDL